MGCQSCAPDRIWAGNRVQEGRRSFLKKRTKKLLRVWARCIRKGRSQTSESFLLLFFKKEDLS
jgi:hypothetical protein